MENIKDLFKLELKDNKVLICPELTKRLDKVFHDAVADTSSFVYKTVISKRRYFRTHRSRRERDLVNVADLPILSEDELSQLAERSLKMVHGWSDEISAFISFGKRELSISFRFTIAEVGFPGGTCRVEERYSADLLNISYDDFLSGKFNFNDVVVLHMGDQTNPHNWGEVPFINKQKDKYPDGTNILNYFWDFSICIDTSRLSLLNILDVQEIRQRILNDPWYVNVARQLDTAPSCEIQGLFNASYVNNKNNRISTCGVSLVKYGKDNNIPELQNTNNVTLLSLLIGNFLFSGDERHKLPLTLTGYDYYGDESYYGYKSYIDTLGNILDKSEEELVPMLSDENLKGIKLIPKQRFTEFFEILKSEVNLKFEPLKERDRQAKLERERRERERKKHEEELKELNKRIVEKLKNSNIVEELRDLRKYKFWELRDAAFNGLSKSGVDRLFFSPWGFRKRNKKDISDDDLVDVLAFHILMCGGDFCDPQW